MKGKSFFFLLLFFFSFILFPQSAWAAEAFVSIIHPIRNRAYWPQNSIQHLINHAQLTKQNNLPATWLVQYDALKDKEIVTVLKNLGPKDEVGLLLEVSESLATSAFVPYIRGDGDWARPDKVFFSGYSIEERKRLVDRLIRTFEASFGYKPKSVGAWYIDAQTLSYLRDRYSIEAVLVCSDQYSTDSYETWGKYFGVPYYPARKNSLIPGQTKEGTIDIVAIQWALRHPVLGYGTTVTKSTYSLQANDYIQFHNLDTTYFKDLFNIYGQTKNAISQVTIGLEVGTEEIFLPELKHQIDFVADEQKQGTIHAVTMAEFASEFKKRVKTNASFAIQSNNLTKNEPWALWWMTPYYRAGLFFKDQRLTIVDIKIYDETFTSIDEILPDRRHVLYRSVSSLIDQAVVQTSLPLLEQVTHIGVEQDVNNLILTADTVDGKKVVKLSQKAILLDGKTVSSADNGPFLKKNLASILGLLAIEDMIPRILRYSTINEHFILGLVTGHDSLIGFQTKPFRLGSFSFDFQTLSRFKPIPPSLPVERYVLSDAQMEGQNFLMAQKDPSLRVLSRTGVITSEVEGGKKIFENEAVQIWKLP